MVARTKLEPQRTNRLNLMIVKTFTGFSLPPKFNVTLNIVINVLVACIADLDGTPTQHREVESNESPVFLSYFKHIVIQSGGVQSGFHHYVPEKHHDRLLQVRKP